MKEELSPVIKEQLVQGYPEDWALIRDTLRVITTDRSKDEAIAINDRTGKQYVLTPLEMS